MQPAAGRTVSPHVRMKPYKLTVNLDPDTHDRFRDWAHTNRLSHQAVLDALVRTIVANPEMAEEVRATATDLRTPAVP